MSSKFLIILGIAFVCNVLVSPLGAHLIVIAVNLLFFIALSLASWLASKRSLFLPSAYLSIALCLIFVGVLLYPRILAAKARTPEEHLVAADALNAI